VERPDLLEMSYEQYFKYLDCRQAALAKGGDATEADTKMVISSKTLGEDLELDVVKGLELDVVKDVVYMIDLDMPKLLSTTYDDFVANFKLKRILPGGKWCMMNAVSDHLSAVRSL
jgi:hypothetical protein